MSEPRPSGLLTVSDYERAASVLLPVQSEDFYKSGAEDEVTLRENKRAFRDYVIRPFCLHDASTPSLSTSFFSVPLAHPIGIAPTAFHRLAHPQGELATVRGAKASNSLMIASSWSTTSLETMVKEAAGHPMWLQLYVLNDRALTQSIIQMAERAGYSAIVLTADGSEKGRRLRVIRNQFKPPRLKYTFSSSDPSFVNAITGNPEIETITWTDVVELVKSTILPVIAKGILRAEDAIKAVDCGVKGIIVSNHGGRQLDSAPATIQVLREIVEALQGKVPVWMDGGIRNGRDVFKALALGAEGVFVGRPVLWGLAVGGETGVAHVMNILRQELEQTMKLAGCPSIESIRHAKDIVVHTSYFARL